MRVPTTQLYGASVRQMSMLTAEADRLQTQVSTQLRFTNAADDPVAWQRVEALRVASADGDAYSGNVSLAQGLVAQTDATLGTIADRVQRARELALQTANGTMTPADRDAVSEELQGLVSDLVTLANTRDTRGQPMFGGAGTALPYVQNADGSVDYVATGDAAAVPIGSGESVAVSVSGARVFGNLDGADGPTDLFAVLTGLVGALGSDSGDTGAIDAAIEGLSAASDQVAAQRASVGARGYRLDLIAAQQTEAATARETERSETQDADLATSIADLQRTLTILQATQSSFTRLTSLSLFERL